MVKCKKIYAIAYGIDPDTAKAVFNLKVHTWNKCKSYVDGVKGARYKSFLTEEEADAWLKTVKVDKHIISKPEIKGDTHHSCYIDEDILENNKELNKKQDIHFEFREVCKELNLSSSTVVLQLKKQFVDFYKSIH